MAEFLKDREVCEQLKKLGGTNHLELLYRNLILQYKSQPIPANSGKDASCLVRFHNCTRHRVTPFWIDHNGRPIAYQTLLCGASINIDTYVNHWWFFKVEVNSSGTKTDGEQFVKVLPLREELAHNTFHSITQNQSPSRTFLQEASMGTNNILVCSLCKFLFKNKTQPQVEVPCPHLTGKAKFSSSDVSSTYLYSCSDNEHRHSHAHKRRNIFLVEPFLNLRERCFLTMKQKSKDLLEMREMHLPMTLLKEYFEFVTVLKKLDE